MRATSQPQRATEVTRHIGTKVREIRKSQGLTQEQVAARVQTSCPAFTRSALMRIEIGQRESVTVDELLAIADAVGARYAELLPTRQPSDPVMLLMISRELRKIAAHCRKHELLRTEQPASHCG